MRHKTFVTSILILILILSSSISLSQIHLKPAGAQQSLNVEITRGAGSGASCASTNSCLSPNPISVNIGDTVTWINNDTVPHTITSGNSNDTQVGTVWDSNMIQAGGSYSFTFSTPGTYNYFDQIHPWITGQVIVGAASNYNNQNINNNQNSSTVTSSQTNLPDQNYNNQNPAPIISEGSSIFVQQKNMECKLKYDSNFYYEQSQDKCMPPSGSWDNPGSDYQNLYCVTQYGSGFYFNSSQNACLPPSGSWSNPGSTFYDHQCEDQFWPDFYYDRSQNKCLPPSGSWQNFVQPQTGVTDQNGTINIQIEGKNFPFQFVDINTGSPLSGFDVAFSIDSKTQSLGVFVLLDPSNKYSMQIVALPTNVAQQSNMPTAWKNHFIPSAFADDSDNTWKIFIPSQKTTVILAVTGAVLLSGGANVPADLAALGAITATYEATVTSIKALDKAGVIPLTDYMNNHGYEERPISVSELSQDASMSPVSRPQDFIIEAYQHLSYTDYAKGLVPSIMSAAMDLNTARSCSPDTEATEVSVGGFESFVFCKPKDAPIGWADYNPQPAPTSLVSLSNNDGFSETIQAYGDESIPLPSDDYIVQISSPGNAPTTQNISVSYGQKTTISTPSQNIQQNNDQQNLMNQNQNNGNSATVNGGNSNPSNNGNEGTSSSTVVEPQPSVSDILNKANNLFYQDDYRDALYYYNNVLNMDPNNEAALTGEGLSLAKLGDDTGAIQAMNHLLQLDNQNANAWALDGYLNYDAASKVTNPMIDESPVYQSAGDDISKSLKIDPRNRAALHFGNIMVQGMPPWELPPLIQMYTGQCTANQYCDIQVAGAIGGSSPYTYQSDTFVNGAPPMGMVVSISNGHLTGNPTNPGTYQFGVCVTDLSGKSSCSQTTVTVNLQNIPPPPSESTSSTTSVCGSDLPYYYNGQCNKCEEGDDWDGQVCIHKIDVNPP